MGINYRGTDSELNGCINDVYNRSVYNLYMFFLIIKKNIK